MEDILNMTSAANTTQTNYVQEEDNDDDDDDNFVLFESFLVISAFIGIIANVLIIVVILKYGKSKVYYNVYLISWCTSNTFFLFATPMLLYVKSSYGCHTVFTCVVFLAANLMFVSALSLHWYITTYCSTNCATKCRNIAKFINFTVWVLISVLLLNSILFCNNNMQLTVSGILLIFCVIFLFLVGVCIQIWRFVKWKMSSVIIVKNYLVLVLVSSFMLSWLPTCLYIVYFTFVSFFVREILVLCFSFGQLNSMIVLILLYCCDQNFKVGVGTLSRCKPQNSLSAIRDENQDETQNYTS